MLSITTVTVNGTTEAGETRYRPFGAQRYSSGQTLTSYQYTGQRAEAGLGLYYYGARWYDPALGRFIQPDTIVPDPGDAKSFDRYAYGLNNPLRYTDPTGHFSNDELEGWFGSNWRDTFNGPLTDYLLNAQFGDLLVYGADAQGNSLMNVLVEKNGMLVGWSVAEGQSHQSVALNTVTANGSGSQQGLYRSTGQFSGEVGGLTYFFNMDYVGYQNAAFNGSNIFGRVGDSSMQDTVTLPLEWYIGGTEHVNTGYRYQGFKPDWSTDTIGYTVVIVNGAKIIAKEGLKKGLTSTIGGPAGATALIVDISQMFKFDAHYSVSSNAQSLPMMPVPSPDSRHPR